jgi:hypothetical protein
VGLVLTGSRRWLVRLVVLAVVASAVARVIQARSRRSGPAGPMVIAGDTWPPVPTKPAGLSRPE